VADFYLPTQDEIRDQILRDYRLEIPGAVTTEGSDLWARATVLAQTLLPIYANGDALSREALPDTAASDKALIRWARIAGVAKLGASAAVGSATVSSSVSTVIPSGTVLRNPTTGAMFSTVGATVFASPGTAAAFLVASATGTQGNALAGTSLEFVATPPGISPTATVITLAGGDAAWTNARWATEILRTLRARPAAGNVAHIIALAETIPGVEQAFVYPALRGTGTLDVVVMTSAASGTRVASASLLSRVSGALRFGARAPSGEFLAGIPADVYENTVVSCAVAQPTPFTLGYQASRLSPFGAWPPATSTSYLDSTQWYNIYAYYPTPNLTSFIVNVPGSGSPVSPKVGQSIAVWFPSVGFSKATITAVSGTGTWTVTVGGWSPAPTETAVPLTTITPWCDQLIPLSTAIFAYFATLGPGEMTPLTSDDIARRCRWPRTSDTNPITGEVEWPTDVGGRLTAAIYTATDAQDVELVVATKTPAVPLASYLGSPPSVLTCGAVILQPIP